VTGDYNGTSKAPMIWQNRVYFLSDRDGTMNLWSMAFDGLDVRQFTHHDDYKAQSPSLSAGRIAYQHGASSSRGPTGAGPR
jgi:tricorn protease